MRAKIALAEATQLQEMYHELVCGAFVDISIPRLNATRMLNAL